MIELMKSGKKLNYENLMTLNINKTAIQRIEDYDFWQRHHAKPIIRNGGNHEW